MNWITPGDLLALECSPDPREASHLPKFHLVLLIHAHQPIGNFDGVMERTYERCYLPFVECLARHPGVRIGLHYSGSLLEWLAERHPEYIHHLGALVARGQVEMVGGGFYEPILITIPREDQIEQIQRLGDFILKHFGKRPSGAWLAERVWEPQLPSALAEAGVEYTLVDDSHFLSAGRELAQLYGYYVAEEMGRTVKVLPGLQELRYLLPFRSVEDSIQFLRNAAAAHPGAFAAMGDDMEKFGAWPHTWEHCFESGWLDTFFSALESNQEWLEVTPPGEVVSGRLPLGRADLPTASYTEMMEWVLPTPVRQRFQAIEKELVARPDVRRFLRGGFWRGFFSKYPEANLLHKKMLRVSAKVRLVAGKSPKGRAQRGQEQARTQVLRAQCNDAYWHGVFGGLYAPHLRTALWRELILAETFADAQRHPEPRYQTAERLDYDADGSEEIEMISPQCAALVKPAGGGTLAALDFRPRGVTLINSLERRVEAYHSRVSQATAQADPTVASIHDRVLAKEPGLERLLRYDRWPRHTFRLLLFPSGKTHADYEALQLDESSAFASGNYIADEVAPSHVRLVVEAPLETHVSGGAELWTAAKTFTFISSEERLDVNCRIELAAAAAVSSSTEAKKPLRFTIGLEMVVNLLAPNEPDRYFDLPGSRHPLAWSGVIQGSRMRMVDEWQDVAIEMEAPGASEVWIAPIETVSESEEGFERVYQGSQILAVWKAEIDPIRKWTGQAVLRVSPARRPLGG